MSFSMRITTILLATVMLLLLFPQRSTAAPQRNWQLCKPPYEITYQPKNVTTAEPRTIVARPKPPKYCPDGRPIKAGEENANCGIHVRQWNGPPYRMTVTVKGNDKMCFKTLTHVKGMLIKNCYYTPWAIKVLELPRGGHITIEKRILYDEPGDQELLFTYGNDTWYSSDDRCKVGKWDGGEVRDMDCRFAC